MADTSHWRAPQQARPAARYAHIDTRVAAEEKERFAAKAAKDGFRMSTLTRAMILNYTDGYSPIFAPAPEAELPQEMLDIVERLRAGLRTAGVALNDLARDINAAWLGNDQDPVQVLLNGTRTMNAASDMLEDTVYTLCGDLGDIEDLQTAQVLGQVRGQVLRIGGLLRQIDRRVDGDFVLIRRAMRSVGEAEELLGGVRHA
ncbi:hypothetical protein [Corynebacterium nuruki]|uniref:hypothetical protein n=1 Tax=Corynebacterium nuruki TaxID=1032851 RepID=UPI0039BFA184